jgi:hypothetical protein
MSVLLIGWICSPVERSRPCPNSFLVVAALECHEAMRSQKGLLRLGDFPGRNRKN